jgi:hypothetical protein
MSGLRTKFYWARVLGSNFEPVEVTKEDGKRVARTIGCPDPFFLDEPDCPCVLGELMERPQTPEQEERSLRHHRRVAALRQQHAWRGPR